MKSKSKEKCKICGKIRFLNIAGICVECYEKSVKYGKNWGSAYGW